MESIVLDDGIEYLIIKEFIIDNIKYTLFVNIDDDKDICFRKTLTINNEDMYVGLDDDKEFDKVIQYFDKQLNG